MEEKLNCWYKRNSDDDFFFLENAFEKTVEGHGFINDEFESELEFDIFYFKQNFNQVSKEYVQNHFDAW